MTYSSDRLIVANGRRLDKSRVVGMSCQCVTLRICLIFLLLTIENVVNLMFPTLRDEVPDVAEYENNMMISRLRMTEAQTAVQDEIKEILGFPENIEISNIRATEPKKSATKFLVDVHKNIWNDKSKNCKKSHKISTKFNLTRSDLDMICRSDIIVAMPVQTRFTIIFDTPGYVRRLWFNASAVPQNARMTGAKLKLYRLSDAKERGAFTLEARRLTKVGDSNKQRQPHIASTGAGDVGWVTLNIRKSLRYFMKHPAENEGLYVTFHPTITTSNNSRPGQIGIHEFNNKPEYEPFVIGFFNSAYSSIPSFTWPFNLTGPQPPDHEKKRCGYTTDEIGEMLEEPCGIRRSRVSVKDIHWDDWVIAPKTFDTNYCSGKCDFPGDAIMKVTNHGIPQANMYNFAGRVRKPSCVSTKLSPISIIHHIGKDNFVLSKFDDMVVDGCGCG